MASTRAVYVPGYLTANLVRWLEVIGAGRGALVDPQQLMRHLVESSELITYKAAHEALFGKVPAWLHAHTQRVVAAALGTTPEKVSGLKVRLDAFVVDAGKRRPGSRHFLGKDYTEKDWLLRFASWDLCQHSTRAELMAATDLKKA